MPKSWEWVRLNNVLDVRDGTHDTPKYIDVGYPLITSKNLYTGVLTFDDVKFISEEDHRKINERSRVDIGDILFAMIGSIGNPIIVDCSEKFSIKNVALFKFYSKDKPSSRYLHYFLKKVQESMRANSSGAVQNFVSLGFLRNYLFPLPPLAEQRRIVVKIDELMVRCDELEKLRGDRDRKQITVHTAALNRLLMAKEQSDFNTAWQFITQHFGELYSVKENVSELRKAILQLAVMGKLVPQDPVDVPAAILLKKIRQRVKELVSQKEEKEIKFESINAKDEAFLLPESWLWVRLGSLLQNIKYGTSKKCNYDSPGTAVLRIPNINVEDGCINVKNLKYTHLSEAEFKELYLRSFDLLIIRSNGSTSLVGRSAVVSETEEGLAYAGYLVRLRLFSEYIYSPYIHYALNTVFVRKQIEQPLRTTSGVKNINSKEIANLLLPLPPFPEQRRIVAKIEQLMSLCDNIEKQIDNADSKQTNLLNAVMTKI